jgi:hypothetical protein
MFEMLRTGENVKTWHRMWHLIWGLVSVGDILAGRVDGCNMVEICKLTVGGYVHLFPC